MKKAKNLTKKQIESITQFISSSDNSALEIRRAQAALLIDSGASIPLINTLTGMRKTQSYAARSGFLTKGLDAFIDHRKNLPYRVLTKAEKEAVIETLKTKVPADVISETSEQYWTTPLLGEYILRTFGKKYKSKTSTYLILHEAKLSWHKPGKRYDKHDADAITKWEEDTRPIIQSYWDEKDTIILTEDEMVLTCKTTTQKVWLPQGEYPPVIETTGTRKNKSFYGFLNLKTGRQHTFTVDWQNMYITAEILTKLRDIYPSQKLVILWDNCGWHRGSKVTEWVEQDGNTERLYFPPYSPELNPQEHVWKEGRKNATHNKHIQDISKTAVEFKDYLESNSFNYELLGFRTANETTIDLTPA